MKLISGVFLVMFTLKLLEPSVPSRMAGASWWLVFLPLIIGVIVGAIVETEQKKGR